MTTYTHPWMPDWGGDAYPASDVRASVSLMADAAKVGVFNAYVLWEMLRDPVMPGRHNHYAEGLLRADAEVLDVYERARQQDAQRGPPLAVRPVDAIRDYVAFLYMCAFAMLKVDARRRALLGGWFDAPGPPDGPGAGGGM